MRYVLGLLALLLAPLISISAVAQQTASPAQAQDSHAALIDTIQANADMDVIMARVLAETDRQFRIEPNFAALEAQSPGTIAQVVKAMAPTLRNYQGRVRTKFRPEMIEAARDVFTADEAQELADFYGSEVGRRFLALLSKNFSVGNVIEGAIDDTKVTADAIRRDQQATVSQTLGALSPAEMQEIQDALAGSVAITKMPQFAQRTMAVQLMVENEPPSASEQQAIEQAITRILGERFK